MSDVFFDSHSFFRASKACEVKTDEKHYVNFYGGCDEKEQP